MAPQIIPQAGQVSALKQRAELNKPAAKPVSNPMLTAPAAQTKPLRQPAVGRQAPLPAAGTPFQGMSAKPPGYPMQSANGGGFSSGPPSPPMQAAAPGLQAPVLRPNLQRQVDAGTMTPEGAANRNAMFHAGQLPGQQTEQQAIDPRGGGDDRQVYLDSMRGPGQSGAPGQGQYGPPMQGGPQQGPAGYQPGGGMAGKGYPPGYGQQGGQQPYPGQGQIPPELAQRLQGNAQNAGQMGYPGGTQPGMGDPNGFMSRMRQDPRFAQMMQQSPPNLGMYYGR